MLDLKQRFDTAFEAAVDTEPPHRDVSTRIAAGRRQVRRQRTGVVAGTLALAGVVGAGVHWADDGPAGRSGRVATEPSEVTSPDTSPDKSELDMEPFLVGPRTDQAKVEIAVSLKLDGRVLQTRADSLFDVEIIEQRQVEFGDRAGDGKEVIALARTGTGETRFLVITFRGDEAYFTFKKSDDFADLDAFEAWARENYVPPVDIR